MLQKFRKLIIRNAGENKLLYSMSYGHGLGGANMPDVYSHDLLPRRVLIYPILVKVGSKKMLKILVGCWHIPSPWG